MSIDIEKESENEECVSINTHIHTMKWCSESMFSIRISWYNRCIKSLLTVECRNKTKQRIDVKLKTNDERNKATEKKNKYQQQRIERLLGKPKHSSDMEMNVVSEWLSTI